MINETDVCVIGAGVSGIVAVKQCLEYGLSVTCYEQRSAVGGLWTGAAPDERIPQVDDNGELLVAIYQSLVMNVSKTLTAFSDFPLPESVLPNHDQGEKFLTGAQFLEFLDLYMRHFKLEHHIQLSTRVLEVAKLESNENCDYRWTVSVRQNLDGKKTVRKSRHRYVIIASGFHSEALIPEIPGKDRTPIEVIHTGHLRQTAALQGKRVLVVGGSISAGDVAEAALDSGAARVTWAALRDRKRSLWMVNLTPFRKTETWDELFSLFSYRHYPAWMMRNLWLSIVACGYQGDNSGIDFDRDRFTAQNIEVIDQALKTGKLEIVPTTIRSFSEDNSQVMFDDGVVKEFDVCILATGYKTTYPFLGHNALGDTQVSDLILQRGMIPVDSSLLGLLFTYTAGVFGGGFYQMEAEARWLTHQIASNRLVTREAHRKLVANSKWNTVIFNQGTKRQSFFIAETLACDMGCEPRLLPAALLSLSPWRRRVALAAAVGPWLPHLYRLRGPHAKPEQAESVIVRCARDCRGWRFTALVTAVDMAHVVVFASAACGLWLLIKKSRTC